MSLTPAQISQKLIDFDKFDVYFSDEQQELIIMFFQVQEHHNQFTPESRTLSFNDLDAYHFKLAFDYTKAIRKFYQEKQQKIAWIKDVRFALHINLAAAKRFVDMVDAAYPMYMTSDPDTALFQAEEPPF